MEKIPHIAGEPYFIKEPNCTETGTQHATCTMCQTIFFTQELDVNDVHNWKYTKIREATCSRAGEGVRTCTRCGHYESCAYANLEHSYEYYATVASACEHEGAVLYICTCCNVVKQEKLPKAGHNWVYYNYYKECAHCNKVQKTNTPISSLSDSEDE